MADKFTERYFNIAELTICLRVAAEYLDSIHYLDHYTPFIVPQPQSLSEIKMRLTIDGSVPTAHHGDYNLLGTFDNGNGYFDVIELPNKNYIFIIKDLEHQFCASIRFCISTIDFLCTLSPQENRIKYGLNSVLMIAFALTVLKHNGLILHASAVRCNGRGYAFTAKSGTGKSTHTGNWIKYIPGCDLINDDNPVIRIIDGKPYIFGTPWSGKTPCYRNIKVPLAALGQIVRANENRIVPATPLNAYGVMLQGVSTMKWNREIFDTTLDLVVALLRCVPMYDVNCLPNQDAALKSWETLKDVGMVSHS